MQSSFEINVQYRTKERRILNTILAIATGILTLIYPEFLYLIAAGYLFALGVMMLVFKMPAIIAAFPLTAGLLIFIFPELIPYTFAAFLGFFGIILLMAFQFGVFGFLTLILAVLIIMNPDSVAYFIAAFVLLYGIADLIKLFREKGANPRVVN